MTTAEELVSEKLAKSIKSRDGRTELADEIISALESAGHLWENGWVETVEVHHARVVVETIERYGLTIELDAHGNAVSVTSSYGFMVTE